MRAWLSSLALAGFLAACGDGGSAANPLIGKWIGRVALPANAEAFKTQYAAWDKDHTIEFQKDRMIADGAVTLVVYGTKSDGQVVLSPLDGSNEFSIEVKDKAFARPIEAGGIAASIVYRKVD
ncbi:MAG: hypothetical protein JNK11_18345 [Alphaproteobacteria bacterium]|nr:hypothetical protein [Alphaproteobacteria bacterium]